MDFESIFVCGIKLAECRVTDQEVQLKISEFARIDRAYIADITHVVDRYNTLTPIVIVHSDYFELEYRDDIIKISDINKQGYSVSIERTIAIEDNGSAVIKLPLIDIPIARLDIIGENSFDIVPIKNSEISCEVMEMCTIFGEMQVKFYIRILSRAFNIVLGIDTEPHKDRIVVWTTDIVRFNELADFVSR